MATVCAIDMARICIPYPTGFIKEDRTYGIKVLGYDTLIYDFYKCVDGKDWDDIKKFKDFYDIGMSEKDMLDMNGWWGTNGKYYLSFSYYEGTVTIDHMTELPDLSSLLGG